MSAAATNTATTSRLDLPYPRVEISLDNLVHNYERICERLPEGVRVMAVVKDCAYGCGASRCAPALERSGASFFAVARMSEARELRRVGLRSPILVLGETGGDEISWAAANNVAVSINDVRSLARLNEQGVALELHCNIDTGMGRLGIQPAEIADMSQILANSKLLLSGVFTHFACADMPGAPGVTEQSRTFELALEQLSECGLHPTVIHCSNSAGIVAAPWCPGTTHVRPGILLYGCNPDPGVRSSLDIRPVASLVGRVVKIKTVPAGTPISYGWQYRAQKQTVIATIDIGYGQGLPRFLSGRGTVLVRGKRLPIAGRVTMDFTMLDAGPDSDIAIGDEAVAFGSQGSDCITVDEIAMQGGTIGYEILCGLAHRITRCYRLRSGDTLVEPYLY